MTATSRVWDRAHRVTEPFFKFLRESCGNLPEAIFVITEGNELRVVTLDPAAKSYSVIA